ncbi:fatty acid desaturase [Thioclava sp. GXIMD4216]|uniref:fatty acid desaturase n=1 Tax=Thioclava sp. GXIMD4216 TaxID=3131929 RepID=UPI0030D163A0
MTEFERAPKGVEYHDLTQIPRYQKYIELALPLPWFVGSLVLYAGPFWPLGFICSFMFFLCCLRLNHEAIHGNLGAPRAVDHAIMHGLSGLMLGSNHADAFCHLEHHRDMMGEGDHEGHCARMSFWEVLRYGPRFPVKLNTTTWARGGARWRRRLLVDWALVAALVLLGVLLPAAWGGGTLRFHLLAMALGQCLTAFFAVWITHQGTDETGLAGRSQRGPLAWVAYLMFYHREHHLFPKVPVSRLPELARRLDATVPGYAAGRQPVVPVWDDVRR